MKKKSFLCAYDIFFLIPKAYMFLAKKQICLQIIDFLEIDLNRKFVTIIKFTICLYAICV